VSKRGTPLKSGYLSTVGLSSVKMVADRHRHAAYHNKHWQRVIWLCIVGVNENTKIMQASDRQHRIGANSQRIKG